VGTQVALVALLQLACVVVMMIGEKDKATWCTSGIITV